MILGLLSNFYHVVMWRMTGACELEHMRMKVYVHVRLSYNLLIVNPHANELDCITEAFALLS